MRRTIQGRDPLVRAYSSGVQPVRSKNRRGRISRGDPDAGDPGVASFVRPGVGEGPSSPAGMAGLWSPCDSPRPSAGNGLRAVFRGCVSLLSALVCVGKPGRVAPVHCCTGAP